ncbi:ATP-binding protein [uncultured Maribacter sp.]|uniref:sensor histidine kinase n=1 Tax=uncultured Maribacter sp. TaxID=431308 RepID=UPI002629E7EC|nr:ATP-binding protein [uncultured Maribacter sp.]
MRILFFVVFFLVSIVSNGQNKAQLYLDSLEQKLDKVSKSERAYILCDLSKQYSSRDSAKAFNYGFEALRYFKKTRDSFGLAKANTALGGAYFDYSDMKIAQNYYIASKEICENLMQKDSTEALIEQWVLTTFNLSATYSNQGSDDKQLQHLLKLAPIAKKYNQYRISAFINTNLGITFLNIQDYSKAYFYLKDNEKQYQKIEEPNAFVTDRLMFSHTLLELDSLNSCKVVLEETGKLLEQMPNIPQWQQYHEAWGRYLSAKGNFKEALHRYGQSMEVIKKNKMFRYLRELYLHYHETYKLMGDHENGKRAMYNFYEQVQGENGVLELDALQELSKYEEKEHNYKKALYYINQYLDLNDSLHKEEVLKEIAILETQYQSEKKEREILALKNSNNETALTLERKKTQSYLLYFVLGSLLFLLALVYIIYRNRQKKSILIAQAQKQEIQILKAEQEGVVFKSMLEGVEQERKRVAVDLHDGLGGRLSGISIKLSKLANDNNKTGSTLPIEDILNNLNDSLIELRSIAKNLMPETLLKYGLKTAVEDYCSTLKHNNTKMVLQFYNTESLKDKNTLLMLYRIIQELINNVIKHANAKEVLIECSLEDKQLLITVEDDGDGMELEQREKGMGLLNLKNRVAYLKGKIDMHSVKGDGTTVNIEIDNIE